MTARPARSRRLSACGGGGGSPTAPPTPAPTPTPGPLYTEVAPLRDAAAQAGRLVGAAVYSSGLASDATYAGAAGRHFNSLTAEWEMKWDPVQKSPGVFDFSGGDAIVAFAESRGMRVKGHALVWHGATPKWVESLSPPELRIAFEDHIRTVAGHYRRRVYAWDVVNEAIDDSQAGLRSTVFSRGLGPDYVAEAFRLARKADPDAQLVYNDYGGEGLNRKSNDVYALVKDLKQRGLVDGVGLQMHISAAGFPAVADIQANIQRLADLGLQVNISEMDVRVKDVAGDAATKLAAAAAGLPGRGGRVRGRAAVRGGHAVGLHRRPQLDRRRLRGGRPAPLRRAVPGQARLLRRGGRLPRALNGSAFSASAPENTKRGAGELPAPRL